MSSQSLQRLGALQTTSNESGVPLHSASCHERGVEKLEMSLRQTVFACYFCKVLKPQKWLRYVETSCAAEQAKNWKSLQVVIPSLLRAAKAHHPFPSVSIGDESLLLQPTKTSRHIPFSPKKMYNQSESAARNKNTSEWGQHRTPTKPSGTHNQKIWENQNELVLAVSKVGKLCESALSPTTRFKERQLFSSCMGCMGRTVLLILNSNMQSIFRGPGPSCLNSRKSHDHNVHSLTLSRSHVDTL